MRRRPSGCRLAGGAVALILASTTVMHAGQFRGSYGTANGERSLAWRELLQNSRFIETIAAALNRTIDLPRDVSLSLAECDSPNAHYNPNTSSVTVCYQLIERYVDAFSSITRPAQLHELVVGNLLFATFHEVGHALIDVLDLPRFGREEDFADQIATWLLVHSGDDGPRTVRGVARYFDIAHRSSSTGSTPTWDEHPLDEQRYYNLICWVYGLNPDAYSYLIEDDTYPVGKPLPRARANRCPEEVRTFEDAFLRSMKSHLRLPSTDPPPRAVPSPPAPSRSPSPTPSRVGPSFDCTKARIRAELMVCADEELSALDRQMAQLYFDLVNSTPPPPGLATEQGRWRRQFRDTCTVRECLRAAYVARIDELSSR